MTDTATPTRETLFLFRVSLLIFTVTVLIGMFNGFHVVSLPQAVLLTHVHAGTLGWITLNAFAAAFWLYRGGPRWLAIAMAVAVPLYVLAFLSVSVLPRAGFVLRAVFGTPVLLLILVMALTLLGSLRKAGLSTPRLGVLLAFTVLTIGSTIGVLIQIQDAAEHTFLPDSAVAGHAAAQVGGYLVLFALSTIDWRLAGTDRLGWGGGVQVVFFFLGGVLVAAGALFNVAPLLAIFIPLDVIGLVIFLVRVGPRVIGARWMEPGGDRHYAIAVPWLVVNLAITIYFIQLGISSGSFDKVPFGLFIAADHAIFLGVMTNLFWGLLHDVTDDRLDVAPWTEHVLFWVMNVALAGFVVTLLTGAQGAEKLFVPFQGLAILLGIVVFSVRLGGALSEA